MPKVAVKGNQDVPPSVDVDPPLDPNHVVENTPEFGVGPAIVRRFATHDVVVKRGEKAMA